MKKFVSLLLSVLILLSMTIGLNLTVFAETISDYIDNYSKENTVLVKNYEGEKSLDTDSYSYFYENYTEEPTEAPLCKRIYSGTCGDNLTWEFCYYDSYFYGIPDGFSSQEYVNQFGSADCKLTISGTGEMDRSYEKSPWDNLKSYIKYIAVEDGVTSINANAFAGCKDLYDITISDSVKNIGEGILNNTRYYDDESNWENGVLYVNNHIISAKDNIERKYSIKENTLTIANGAFADSSSLEEIIIPDSVENIGDYAFQNCTNLTSITIPGNVKNIGCSAFENCTSITDLSIDNGLINIGENAFKNCESVT